MKLLLLLLFQSWVSIPGSEMRTLYVKEIDEPWKGASRSFQNIQAAESGGVCVGNELVVWGGGHGDGANNGVFAVNVFSGEWRRVTFPSVEVSRTNGLQTNPDGTPVSRHTYELLVSHGDTIYISGGGLWPGGGGGNPPSSWKLALDHATPEWVNFANSPAAAAHGNMQRVGKKFYLAGGNGASIYDLETDTWTPRKVAQINANSVMEYSPEGDKFYVIGGGWLYKRLRSNFGTNVKTDLPDFPIPPGWEQFPLGLKFVHNVGAARKGTTIYLWDGGPSLVAIDTVTDGMTVVTPSGNPGPSLNNGTYGRFSYCGGRLVLVNGVDQPLFYLEGL